MVSKRCHNALFSCCFSLPFQNTALTFMSTSVSPSFFRQLRYRHAAILRLRLSFLSFFGSALLPSSTRQSTVRLWLWKFCCSKIPSASYVRICALGLNFIVSGGGLCYVKTISIIVFSRALWPDYGSGSPLVRLPDQTHWTHHTLYDSPGRVISSTQRPLPDNTQHSPQTNIYAAAGIRAQNPSKRATTEARLRPLGHLDQHMSILWTENIKLWNQQHFLWKKKHCAIFFKKHY
jgi:hypothetical protein